MQKVEFSEKFRDLITVFNSGLRRSHHQAYECIELDAEAQGLASCNPTEKASVGFTYEFRIETNEEGKGDMVLQCSEDQDWCTEVL